MSRKRGLVVTVCGGVSLTLMISAPLMAAVTAIPQPIVIPLTTDVSLMHTGPLNPVLVHQIVTLNPGQIRRVFGRVEVAGSSDDNLVVEVYAQCVGPDGITIVSNPGGASQNYEGKDTPPGTNYPSQGHLVLYPTGMVQAPVTGTTVTYDCQLTGTSPDGPLTAVANAVDGSNATWLKISAENEEGAGWWQNPACDESGTYGPTVDHGNPSWCLYLAGASNVQQIYIFDNDGSLSKTWVAPSDAAFVDASDSLMLTTCYYGTGSCTADNSQGPPNNYWPTVPVGTSVDTHLELIQLNSAGTACITTQSPEQRSLVGNAPHHYMIYHWLSAVPVYPECVSHLFKLRISVKYDSGNPVKIDGYTWTHGDVVVSYKGSASPIPSVAGLSESVAASSLSAAGYGVSTVSYVLNAAPAGTVLSQNPSTTQLQLGYSAAQARIIEVPGSGMALTVSTGGVYLPNLLYLSQANATADIRALGLVPSVSFSKQCINPGDVLVESPLAGTLVAPGSTVHITVDSGTRQTCILK
jgi:hypothetical protein